MPKALESFTIVPSDEGYVLQIEDEDGTTLELVADFDQLELIAEEIERRLEMDEDEADDEDEETEDPES